MVHSRKEGLVHSGQEASIPGGDEAGGAGHTPGSWRFDERSMTGAVWAEDEFIASVYPNAPDDWDCISDYDRIGEMRANARLIAAAPCLLTKGQALQVARKAHKLTPSAGSLSRVRQASREFDEAIAKAVGDVKRDADPIHRRDGGAASGAVNQASLPSQSEVG